MAYQRWWKTIRDQQGNAVNGASCAIYNAGTSTLATVFDPNTDDLSPSGLTNPYTTGPSGEFGFMAVDGEYDVQISGGSIATQQHRVTLNASTVTYNGAGVVLAGDLSAGTGAGMVGYLQPLTGSVVATQAQINSEWYSVFRWFTPAQIADWKARTTLVDVTDAIQSAIDNVPLSATLYFPPGAGLISDPHSNGYCLLITRPIKILGSGTFYSALTPVTGLGAAVDIIRIQPSASYVCDLTTIEGLFIGKTTDGTCAGRNTIYVLINGVGMLLPKLDIRNVSCGTSSNGYSFKHLSSIANAGMYSGLIQNNIFRSGMWLENIGDSNVVKHNLITGSNIGIYATHQAGSSCLSIEDNNITATAGAIKIDYASRLSIRHNNIEAPSGAGSNGAIIDINGGIGVSYGGSIRDNLISGFGTSTVNYGIRVKQANGLHIEDNVFLSGVSSLVSAITMVDTSAQNTRIGPNTYNAGFWTPSAYNAGTTYSAGQYVTSNQLNWISLVGGNLANTPGVDPTKWQVTAGPKIIDSGQGTCGVIKPIVLVNGWVPYAAAYSQPYYYKDLSGVVHTQGLIKTGTATPGTTLWTFGVGFRPDHFTYQITHSLGGAVAGVGSITFTDTTGGAGVVTINSGGNTMFSLDGLSFVAAGLADGVSAE